MCFCVVSVCVLFFFSMGHVPEINDKMMMMMMINLARYRGACSTNIVLSWRLRMNDDIMELDR